MRIFHIVEPVVWADALVGRQYRPQSLVDEGFVHFSFADQVAEVANARYRDVGELCVVEVDSGALVHDIRVEDSYGSGTRFPHVYGPVPTAAAVAVHRLERGENGAYTFSPGARSGGASTDR